MTRIRSAARTVDSRWAITSAVRPASASPSAACTAASEVESRWAVASSRITTRGLGQQQPGDRQPLALAAGEPVAALADHRVEPVGQAIDQVGQPGPAQRVPQLVVGRLGRASSRLARIDVVEQVPVLGDHAERLADRVEATGRGRRRRPAAPRRRRRRRAAGSSEAMVDFPAPDEPTRATIWPGSARNDTPCSTSTPPRVSSVATSSSEASDTLSADG